MSEPPARVLPSARGRTARRQPVGVSVVPTLRVERQMLRGGCELLAAVDEVGRGALAGPVTVGVVLVDGTVRTAPKGLRDSKLLTPAAREALAPRLRRWALDYAVGHASAAEIDAVGILAALRTAGERAFAALPVRPDAVLLDGNHDWLTRRPEPPSLFDGDDDPWPLLPPVRTLVKADLRCASVAAASVLAKTTRDGIMTDLALRHPAYGWDDNRGYATPVHQEALRAHGPCAEHRQSWRLPCAPSGDPEWDDLLDAFEAGGGFPAVELA